MRKPEFDLSPPNFDSLTLKRAATALSSGHWANGPRVLDLEEKIASKLGCDPRGVIATNSATTALIAATRAFEIEDCVKVRPMTWPATYLGATVEPEWLDHDDLYPNISVELWGQTVTVAGDDQKAVIIDCAHNVLADHHGDLIRNGHAIVYSFSPQKEVPSPGGGMLITKDIDIARGIREQLSGFIFSRTWLGEIGGVKGLMDDVTASIVRQGFNNLNKTRQRRLEVLAEYERHLGSILITKPDSFSGHLCVVRAPNKTIRDHWRRLLIRRGIAVGHHYPLNPIQREECPIAAEESDCILTLPLHTRMDGAAVRRVCAVILTA